jgi:hypothetical protein
MGSLSATIGLDRLFRFSGEATTPASSVSLAALHILASCESASRSAGGRGAFDRPDQLGCRYDRLSMLRGVDIEHRVERLMPSCLARWYN